MLMRLKTRYLFVLLLCLAGCEKPPFQEVRVKGYKITLSEGNSARWEKIPETVVPNVEKSEAVVIGAKTAEKVTEVEVIK